MPRKKYKKRVIKGDVLYNSFEVAKLINYVMVDGKKKTASKIVYKVLDEIKKKNLDPLEVLERAIKNTSPEFEVRSRRVGGASYLVPIETRPERKLFLSLNWIIEGAKMRSSREYNSFDKKLFAEIIDAYQGVGNAVEKRKNIEKLAEANKAFSHLKW